MRSETVANLQCQEFTTACPGLLALSPFETVTCFEKAIWTVFGYSLRLQGVSHENK